MLAAALTLVLFGFILTLVIDVMRQDGAKILAALDGRSWTAGPTAGRPMMVRFSPADRPVVPPQPRPVVRAAA